jgi:hypothetical protein
LAPSGTSRDGNVPYNSYQHHRQRDGETAALLFLNYALVQACCLPLCAAMS